MKLFSRTNGCHERGICQRVKPQCHQACHAVIPSVHNEPPIGYEAAPGSNVRQLRYDQALHQAANQPAKCNTQPRKQRAPRNAMGIALGLPVLLVAVLALWHGLASPDSWLYVLARAAMSVIS